MHEDECNILGMDLFFGRVHNDCYSLDAWSTLNPICIARRSVELFAI